MAGNVEYKRWQGSINPEMERKTFSPACALYNVGRSFFMKNKTVYFQPLGIKPQYCEAGMISETDPEYIWYFEEPCKILISEVKIIPKEEVIYDKKKRSYLVKSAL